MTPRVCWQLAMRKNMSDSMTKYAITCEKNEREKAAALARELQAPLLSSHDQTDRVEIILHVDRQGLSLCAPRISATPLRISPTTDAQTANTQHPLAKAIGLQKYPSPRVLDATAGLGQDAMLLDQLGCRMLLIERHPALYHMLKSTLTLPVVHANAISWLPKAKQFFDIIYLDPMFPARKKSALVKKNCQLLQKLLGADNDADALLTVAAQYADKRVVVKRSKQAPHLQNIIPNGQVKTRTIRFDIYDPQTLRQRLNLRDCSQERNSSITGKTKESKIIPSTNTEK